MSRVDVLVICYNQGRYLQSCVESVITQPVDGLRVLILDDYSVDDSADIACGLAAIDDRIEVRRHLKNVGAIATFNEAVEWSSGEFVHLIAADDLLTPGALSRNLEALERDASLSFVFGQMSAFDIGEIPVKSCDVQSDCYSSMSGAEFIRRVCNAGANIVPALTVTVRGESQRKAGYYSSDLPLTHDMDMWLRLSTFGAVGCFGTVQGLYRVHGGNLHLKFSQIESIVEVNRTIDGFLKSYSGQCGDASVLREIARSSLLASSVKLGQELFEANRLDALKELLMTMDVLWPKDMAREQRRLLSLKCLVGRRLWRGGRCVWRLLTRWNR